MVVVQVKRQARFQVLAARKVKMNVFCDVARCSLVKKAKRVRTGFN
jgi:hypothetical protein